MRRALTRSPCGAVVWSVVSVRKGWPGMHASAGPDIDTGRAGFGCHELANSCLPQCAVTIHPRQMCQLSGLHLIAELGVGEEAFGLGR